MTCKFFDEIIEKKHTCLIIPHQSPDGDCLGSSYALSSFFDGMGIRHKIAMNDLIPLNFAFLKKDNMLRDEDLLALNETFDVTLILDTSSPDRVGASQEVVDLGSKVLVIDHHKTNTFFGDVNVVEEASSVGEILYQLMGPHMDGMDLEVAKGLYTSIVTDTGEFRYSNTTATTMRVAGHLFESGLDFGSINKEIFSNKPLNQVRLKSQIMADMHLYEDNKIIIFSASQATLKTYTCEMYHTDGIVEAGRDIMGCEVSILLKEMDTNMVKVSMRSNHYVDVSEISLKFKGGGHARAAGCTLHMPLDQAEATILSICKEYL